MVTYLALAEPLGKVAVLFLQVYACSNGTLYLPTNGKSCQDAVGAIVVGGATQLMVLLVAVACKANF